MSILLADCGNSAIKLSLDGDRGRVAPDPAALEAWLAGRRADVLHLLPGAAAGAAVVRAWWRGPLREAGRDLPVPDLGQYPGMGLDRIVAGLAAGPDCIVIDAGTATTLGAWDRTGRFAGGLILPGARAMIAGLVAAAPALPAVTPLPADASAAQRSTAGAIGAAAGIGHPAMVAACLARLGAETGIRRTIITGGGGADLVAAGIIPGAEHRPWLVLDGLALLRPG